MPPLIKICGVKSADIAINAAAAGATHLGFVFFKKSPRFIDAAAAEDIVTEVKQASYDLGFEVPGFVGLYVDGGESALAEAAPFLTHFQFHGHESPDRCAAVRAEFGIDVIKAVSVGGPEDAAALAELAEAADMLLFDGKPPKNAERPGGNGEAFDWSILRAYAHETPFLVAGGLTSETVAAAVSTVKDMPAFAGVDVSSGVETQPGVKDAAKVAAFIRAAKAAF
ncbi:MAG: phosphoribosylanthranilate isomerase [Pseudomonadota bacterium]|nr:phosphoribosylanthranilate isomerase [Pseudomonadota bacterium]